MGRPGSSLQAQRLGPETLRGPRASPLRLIRPFDSSTGRRLGPVREHLAHDLRRSAADEDRIVRPPPPNRCFIVPAHQNMEMPEGPIQPIGGKPCLQIFDVAG